MNKNVIKFSEDGSEFQFLFIGGGESDFYSSKKEGFKALTDLSQKGKITVEEFSEIRNQILDSENLPWDEGREITVAVIGGGIGLLGEMLLGSSLSSLADVLAQPDEPVEVAYFKPCDCGKHGRIYCKTGHSKNQTSKKYALGCLDHFKEEGHITEDEYSKVKAEIEASSLPD